MIPDDVKPILESLHRRSKRGEVEWLESSAAGQRVGDFVVLFPSSSIAIWEERDSPMIEGRILNQRGDTVLGFWANTADKDYEFLADLLELARRKVVRVDETLAEIRKTLDAPARVGEALGKASSAKLPDDDEEVPF